MVMCADTGLDWMLLVGSRTRALRRVGQAECSSCEDQGAEG